MKIQDRETANMYNRGKQIAENLFIEDAMLAVHTSKNLEADLRTLANQYSIDVDIKKLVTELEQYRKESK